MITYCPFTHQKFEDGDIKPNRTCGDCSKNGELLYYENEFGRFNHGVCWSCWVKRGSEELNS